jgi:hypothetical protein
MILNRETDFDAGDYAACGDAQGKLTRGAMYWVLGLLRGTDLMRTEVRRVSSFILFSNKNI